MADWRHARHRAIAAACGVAALGVGMTACGGDPQPPDAPPDVPAAADRRLEQRQPSRLPERVVMPVPEGERSLPPEAVLGPVLADASKRTGIAVTELVVADSWQKVWSDGSLGCPGPGEYYTQALVPGWQVLVLAGSQTLDYRLSERGYFKLCGPGKLELRGPGERTGPGEERPRS